ncbi:PREDICTED: odorant receptor 4-like [Dufourea novaeangliae]|uniref:odorant receptor 4-like n=1 Tax=Dufourea novaeangliae TaxID=178035 RepID=UPI000767B2D0|nr:PREDICTED: odorant receptor 4-like [Dufourea novaeangliae]
MNIHVTGQFRILQYRLSKLYEEKMLQTDDHTPDKILLQYTTKCYAALQSCIRQHQALITYCNVLEVVFSKIVLGQVLTFSALICLQGYQLLLSDAHLSRRLLFMCFLTTTMCQLLMFTYSCDGLVQESSGIGTAAYISPWPLLPMSRQGHKLRDDLRMVVIRSRTPCCLTASGFFPISLETYTTVLSTAMSYFTLLRQSTIS